MKNMRIYFLAIAIIGLATGVTSCAKGKVALKPNSGKYYAVSAEKTGFYRYGPQQGNGADQQLPRDTLLTLVRTSFGYCKVQLTNGGEGYVAREDIRPAPPTLIAALTAPPPTPASSAEQFDLNSVDPRLAPPSDDLPAPDLPPVDETPAESTEPTP